MRASTLDALFALQYTTLTTGTLLTAFLLALGASAFHIGLVATLPLLGGLLQPLGARLIHRSGGWRKPAVLVAAVVDVLLWGVTVGAVAFLDAPVALVVVVAVLAVQQMANAVVGVAWTSWMSDLVPATLRGRYFSRRSFIGNSFAAITAVVAGRIVQATGPDEATTFLWVILAGAAFRLLSIFFLHRQVEPGPARYRVNGLFGELTEPFLNSGFRRFLLFGVVWGFSVHLAAPFFNVYMLRDVGLRIDTVALFAAFATGANLLGQRYWGPLTDRYGDHQVMRAAGLVIAFQPFWWLFTSAHGSGVVLMGVLSAVGGFVWAGFTLATGNLMMRLAPEIGKTSFFAVQGAVGGLFGAAGPYVGGILAEMYTGHTGLLPVWIFSGLKSLFFLSFALRLAAWVLLHRVPDPVKRPRLRTMLLIRDAVRTFNPTQGFSPLLHVFTPLNTPHRRRPVRTRKSRSSEHPTPQTRS